MLYIKYTYVDAVTKKSIIDEPAANGPASPEVTGLAFGFALESQYPTNSPVFYGTASDDADLTIAGVIGSVTKADYDAAQVAELKARDAKAKAQLLGQIANTRYQHEIAGTVYNSTHVETTRESRAMLLPVAFAASLDNTYTSKWKSTDGFIQLTSTQILGLASTVRAYVQACFDRESVLISAVTGGTFDAAMLAEGWPT